MAQTIKLKRSNTSGSKPTTSNLALGEIALNTKDGLFFLRRYVDGTDGNDTITAYTPEYLNEYDSQIDVTVTVDTKTAAHPEYGNGSSDGFLLDGLEGPFLVLTPGNTYRFDQSDSSNTGHPLRFYYESNKTTSFTTGVTTNGTAGSSGAYTQIAVTTSTPQVLYYQCSSHSLMGSGSFSIAGTIVEDQLAANSVTSAKIASNAVTSSEIAANAITSSEIAANAVGTSEIAANSITSAHISSGVVIEADVADNAITSAKIAENAVGSSEIAANAVGSSEIAANAVTTSEIAANAVTSSELATNSVTSSKIAANAITAREIAASGVSAASYGSSSAVPVITVDADGRITSATTAAISGLAANAVTATEIAANAVGSSEIAANAVGSSEIASNSVGIDELNVTDGTSGQVLTTDGAGTLSFSTVSGGGGSQNLFSTIAVSGQSDIVADSTTDTLTIVAGSGITLGTNASTDTLTITATGGGGLSANAVTSAYLASNAVLARHIAANAIGASEIASSGATAGTYGSATATPQITVDADGRISSVSNVTITGSGGSAYGFTNQVDQDSFTGDGSTTSFDTGATITDENLTWIFIDGVYQQKNSYSVSGSSVVFSAAPPNGTTIEVMHLRATTTGSGLNTNSFNGDGSTTDFILATTPQSEDDIIAFIGGVFQNQDSYTFSGTTLSFDTAPANGTKIVVYVISGVITGKANLINNFSGDNSTTDFTLSINPQHENNINVFIDGVYQQKSEFSVSGTTLTFSSAPPSGTNNIEVEINQITTTTSLAANTVTAATIAANAVGSAEIAANAVGSSEIAANAIGTSELSSGALNGQTFTGDSEITGEFTANEFIGDLRGAQIFKAQAGENLTLGQVVYISGISGNTTVVSLADADDAAKMPAFGIVAATTTSGQPVDIYTSGILGGLDTSAYSEGDELFVSTTAGALTDTAPTGETAKLQKIAKVTRSNNLSGSIFITGAGRTNAVPNLDDGDIFIGNASNQAVTASLNTKIEDYLDAGTSTPTFASFTMSNSTATAYDGTADQEGATVRIINTNNTTSDTFADIRFESHSSSTGRARIGMELPSVNNSELFFVTENSGSLAEAMRINSAGNVGIGTNNPSKALVISDGGNQGIELSPAESGTSRLFSYNRGTSVYTNLQIQGENLTFYTNASSNTEAMRIDSSGKVGISNTSPSSYSASANNLVVGTSGDTGITIVSGTVSNGQLKFADGTTGDATGRGIIDYNHASDHMAFKTAATEAMRINSAGNVGIGTTSPQQPLVISNAGGIGFEFVPASGILQSYNRSGGGYSNFRIDASTFFVHTGSSATERMRIDSSGHIGFNTTPSTGGGSGAFNYDFYSLTNGASFVRSIGHGGATQTVLVSSINTGYVGTETNHPFLFVTNNTERMRISSSGQLNIGATTSASGNTKLEVQYGLTVKHSTTIGQLRNIYMDDSSGTLKFYDGYNIATLSSAGAWTNASDIAYKENIVDTEHGLDVVKLLQPRDYTLKSDSSSQTGFIAQELEMHLPQFVNGDEGEKGVNYGQLTAVLTKAIQEQQTIIEDLKARIETLENN